MNKVEIFKNEFGYIKNESYDILLKVRKSVQILEDTQDSLKHIHIQYDL